METFLWPLVIFHVIVGIVGLPGNALIILVYGRKRQMMSPHVFILALAAADLMVCLFTPVTVYHWSINLNYTSDFLCRLVLTASFITVYNSCFLTSAIAVDRYQAICRPHRRWMTVRRARVTAVACALVAILISIPVYASYGVVLHSQESNTGHCVFSQTVPSWVTYFTLTVIYAASLCTLLTNIVLYGKMYRAIRKQAAVRPGQQRVNERAEDMSSLTLPRAMSRNLPSSTGDCGNVVASVSASVSQNTPSLATTSHSAPGRSLSADVESMNGNPPIQQQRGMCQRQQHRQGQQQQQQHRQHRQGQQQQKQPQQHKAFWTINMQKPANVSNNIRFLNRINNPGRQRPRAQRLYNKTTKMLVVTTAVFFATWLVTLVIVSIPQNINDYISETNQVGYSILYLFRFIFYLNNAINPFIYGFVNKQFREDCKKTLSALRKRICRVTP